VHGPGSVELDLPLGTTFSVLAMHGPATGVTVTGARWPLVGHALAPLVGLGVSNVVEPVADEPLTIAVTDGIVTVVVPGAAS
jgi:thiamine pyrophosphokinase